MDGTSYCRRRRRNRLDVEYLEVSTYRRQPKVRVIQRYTPTYRWRPWHRYTYLYFYDGPVYYTTDYDYYLRWSYPIYDHHYLSIALALWKVSRTLSWLLSKCLLPLLFARITVLTIVTTEVRRKFTSDGHSLNRWSAQHEKTRQQYSRSRLSASSRREDRTAMRRSVRTTLEKPSKTDAPQQQSGLHVSQLLHRNSAPLPRPQHSRQNRIRQSTYSSASTIQ